MKQALFGSFGKPRLPHGDRFKREIVPGIELQALLGQDDLPAAERGPVVRDSVRFGRGLLVRSCEDANSVARVRQAATAAIRTQPVSLVLSPSGVPNLALQLAEFAACDLHISTPLQLDVPSVDGIHSLYAPIDQMAGLTEWIGLAGSYATSSRMGIDAAFSTARPGKGNYDPAVEMGVAMAAIVDLISTATDLGRPVGQVCSRLSLLVPVQTHFPAEVAKLRAARLLFGEILASYGLPRYGSSIFICAAVGVPKDAAGLHQLLPQSAGAIAAVVGGADLVAVEPLFNIEGLSAAAAGRLAIDTLAVLDYESHLGDVADPAAGSYYLEALTSTIARKAWELVVQIEGAGGYGRAAEAGLIETAVLGT